MDFKQLDRGELLAVIGGLVLAVSLFLAWYSLGNHFAKINHCHGPNRSTSASSIRLE